MNLAARRAGSRVVVLAFAVLLSVVLIPGQASGGVDGDGSLDAVFANGNANENSLCVGDGFGGFPPRVSVGSRSP